MSKVVNSTRTGHSYNYSSTFTWLISAICQHPRHMELQLFPLLLQADLVKSYSSTHHPHLAESLQTAQGLPSYKMMVTDGFNCYPKPIIITQELHSDIEHTGANSTRQRLFKFHHIPQTSLVHKRTIQFLWDQVEVD